MNLFQKFCALFRAEYVVVLYYEEAYIRRVKRLAAGIWVSTHNQQRLKPGGAVLGPPEIRWKPLTKGVEKFYLSDGDVRCKALTPTAYRYYLGTSHEQD